MLQGREAGWTSLVRTISLPHSGVAATYSHDGRMLAVCGNDFTQLFRSGTGERLAELESSCGKVLSVSFSCDDQTLATVSRGTVRLWDITTGSRITTLNIDMRMVDFHPYINHLLVAGDNLGQVWFCDVKKCSQTAFNVPSSKGILCWLHQQNQNHVLVGCLGRMELWDVISQQQVCVFPWFGIDQPITSVASFANGSLVAANFRSGTVVIYNTYTRTIVRSHNHNNLVFSIAFSPVVSILAIGANNPFPSLFIFHYDGTPDHTVSFAGHSKAVSSVAFSPNGGFLASTSSDCTVRIWKVEAPITAYDNVHHTQYIKSLHFSNDGQLTVSVSHDK
jgi:WD40 repeat protein